MRSHTLSSTVTSRRVFGRGSPVLDYWLGHSEGFELTSPGGDHRGVVEEVVIDERGYYTCVRCESSWKNECCFRPFEPGKPVLKPRVGFTAAADERTRPTAPPFTLRRSSRSFCQPRI